ncbi:MAG: hypothetical protein IPM99_07030 [Rubrivivax sp.]|nr:hypothetical protein [Rubrivivax sp.]
MLPASSWQRRLMGNLKSHFGSDASVDAATTQADDLADGQRRQRQARRGHARRPHHQQRLVRARTPRGAPLVPAPSKVKTAADCAACHTKAAEGSYREREIRLPR